MMYTLYITYFFIVFYFDICHLKKLPSKLILFLLKSMNSSRIIKNKILSFQFMNEEIWRLEVEIPAQEGFTIDDFIKTHDNISQVKGVLAFKTDIDTEIEFPISYINVKPLTTQEEDESNAQTSIAIERPPQISIEEEGEKIRDIVEQISRPVSDNEYNDYEEDSSDFEYDSSDYDMLSDSYSESEKLFDNDSIINNSNTNNNTNQNLSENTNVTFENKLTGSFDQIINKIENSTNISEAYHIDPSQSVFQNYGMNFKQNVNQNQISSPKIEKTVNSAEIHKGKEYSNCKLDKHILACYFTGIGFTRYVFLMSMLNIYVPLLYTKTIKTT